MEAQQHLVRLRDYLDLPFNSLKDDELVFSMADQHRVVVTRTQSGHLLLVCEIGTLAALGAGHWRNLLTRLTDGYDHTFPASLVTVDGKLALAWSCRATIDEHEWMRRAEDAITCALDMHARLSSNVF